MYVGLGAIVLLVGFVWLVVLSHKLIERRLELDSIEQFLENLDQRQLEILAKSWSLDSSEFTTRDELAKRLLKEISKSK